MYRAKFSTDGTFVLLFLLPHASRFAALSDINRVFEHTHRLTGYGISNPIYRAFYKETGHTRNNRNAFCRSSGQHSSFACAYTRNGSFSGLEKNGTARNSARKKRRAPSARYPDYPFYIKSMATAFFVTIKIMIISDITYSFTKILSETTPESRLANTTYRARTQRYGNAE